MLPVCPTGIYWDQLCVPTKAGEDPNSPGIAEEFSARCPCSFGTQKLHPDNSPSHGGTAKGVDKKPQKSQKSRKMKPLRKHLSYLDVD